MAIWNFCCLRDTIERIKEGQLPRTLNNLPCCPDFKEVELVQCSADVDATPKFLDVDKESKMANIPEESTGGCNTVGSEVAKMLLREQFTEAERTKPSDDLALWSEGVKDGP